jgi:hypothetical protein
VNQSSSLKQLKEYDSDNLMLESINELGSYSKPPSSIVLVGNAICILMNEIPSWENFKKLVKAKRPTLIQSLSTYDKDKIS